MVASDFSNPKDNRIKIYVRTRSTCFADFEGLITLGGTLRSPSIDRGIQVSCIFIARKGST